MIKRHKTRRPHIAGRNGIRNLARDIADSRTHWNFTERLSGYDADGNRSGPYSGVRLLREHEHHEANDDELSADFAGCFSKGLKHGKLDSGGRGLVDAAAYRIFAETLTKIVNEGRDDLTLAVPNTSGTPSVIERFDGLAKDAMDKSHADAGDKNKGRTYVNPLAGIATSLDGIDPMDVAIPPAPALSSRLAAAELLELYWMALLRDVPFDTWKQNPDAVAAVAELDSWNQQTFADEKVWFAEHSTSKNGNPSWDPTITLNRLFRGSAPGVDEGDYLSVFLRANVPFGTIDFEQKQNVLKNSNDYVTDPLEWYDVQIGTPQKDRRNDLEVDMRSLITNLRELAHYVHYDALHEAYFNAALILDGSNAPLNAANVYTAKAVATHAGKTFNRDDLQHGFGTFGGPHVLTLLTEVATWALKAVWHQKWMVHRRLRPEAMGARLHSDSSGWGPSFVHPDLRDPAKATGVERARKNGSWLLPMAFPEGSPMHPSYGAGHATVAGACVTILKAMFDTRTPMARLMANIHFPGDFDPTTISPSTTVEGELNKLAANIAIGRNGAGVHYRTDYTKSLALGEAVAASILQENALTFADVDPDRVFTWPTFDGHWVCVDSRGRLSRCAMPAEPVQPSRTRSLFQQ